MPLADRAAKRSSANFTYAYPIFDAIRMRILDNRESESTHRKILRWVPFLYTLWFVLFLVSFVCSLVQLVRFFASRRALHLLTLLICLARPCRYQPHSTSKSWRALIYSSSLAGKATPCPAPLMSTSFLCSADDAAYSSSDIAVGTKSSTSP